MERPSRSPTTSGHETELPLENDPGKQDADAREEIAEKWQWLQKLQEEHNTPISDENRRRLEECLTINTCKIYINDLKEKYEKKRGSKFVKAIKPVVKWLKAYTDGLNPLLKNPAALSIAWGVVQLILECAEHSYKSLKKIVKLIGSYTHTLSVYLEYAKDFIGYPRLDEALISMYMAYLDTCIRAANFLEKSASANFLRGFFWGKKKFRDMGKGMADLEERFEIVKMEVDYAKHQRDHTLRCDIQIMASFQGPSKWYMMQEHEGWTKAKMLPLDRKVNYTPRGMEIDEVEEVKRHLNTVKTASDGNARFCVIHGVFGIGKTQLALEIACQWKGPVFWLNAESQFKLKESFDEIARILRLDVEPGMHGKEPGNLAKQWLATHNGWLLVYDNATSFEAMAEVYWPTLSQGSVLVTTRSKDLSIPKQFAEQIISLGLLPMSKDTSKKFLKHCLGENDANEDDLGLEQMSTFLGGLPLALAHVAECIKSPEIDITDVKDVMKALKGCSIPLPDIWSADHRQSPKNLQSWPYERLPREALDQLLSSLEPSALSLLDSLVIFDVSTPLSAWPEDYQDESLPLFNLFSNCLTVDDQGLVSVHPIVKLDIRRRFYQDETVTQEALNQAKEALKRFFDAACPTPCVYPRSFSSMPPIASLNLLCRAVSALWQSCRDGVF